ncbi:hypothetical protein [Streptomyces sp. NPDC093568]|uniref:hypothetical protein n=1 Tax=Streptomyces sp. NPDC093568 TaxID=3366041 RepID=UPI0038061FF1
MQERTSTTERYTRGVAAALVAVATLILAANAGPARAAVPHGPSAECARHLAVSGPEQITATSLPTPCYGPGMQRANPSLTTTPDPVPAR